MNRKIRLLLIPVLLAALCVVLLGPIERLIVRHYLVTQAEAYLGYAVSLEGSSYRDGVLVVHKPEIVTDDGLFSLTAEELKISYAVGFWRRELHLNLEWMRPRLMLSKEALSTPQHSMVNSPDSWFHSDITMKVLGGQIGWKGDLRELPVATVHAEMRMGGTLQNGAVSLALAGSDSRGMRATWDTRLGQAGVTMHLQEMPGDLLLALSKLKPGYGIPFEVSQGAFTGDLEVYGAESGYQAKGEVAVDDLVVRFTTAPLYVRIKGGKLLFSDSVENGIGGIVQGQGDITLAVAEPPVPRSWKLEGFKGLLSYSPSGLTTLSCRSQWWHDGVVKALRLDGKSTPEALFDGALSFAGHDGVEASMALQWKSDGTISASASRLDADEVAFLRHSVARRFMPLNGWSLSRGYVSGLFIATSKELRVENLLVTDSDLKYPLQGLSISASSIQGGLSWVAGRGVARSELTVADGTLSVGSAEMIRQFQGKLAYQEDAIGALRLSGSCNVGREPWAVHVKGDALWSQKLLECQLVDLSIDHSIFRLETSSNKALNAKLLLDSSNRILDVTMPLTSAAIIDKVHDIVYSDVSTVISYRDGLLRFHNWEGTYDGLSAGGDASITGWASDDGAIECVVDMKKLSGTVTQLKRYLQQIGDGQHPLYQLPIEGALALQDSGSLWKVTADNDDVTVEGSVKGEMRDGSLLGKLSDIAVRELGLSFTYAYPVGDLAITDLQGTVLVGRPGQSVEEYRLFGDKILLPMSPDKELLFDLWLGDKVRDVVRAAGQAYLSDNAEGFSRVDFTFDEALTHFGNVHPTTLELTLQNWSQISKAELVFQFDLATLLHDLQRLGRIGFPLLSYRLQQELQNLSKAKGSFFLALQYDGTPPTLSYVVKGDDVIFNDHSFHEVSLAGSVQGDNWVVDQLKLDDLSFAADLHRYPERWKINFLGMRCAGALMMGLEGNYWMDSNRMQGRINLLEANFSQFDTWEMTRYVARRFPLRGELRAQGNIEVQVMPSPSWAHITADLDASLRAVQLGGVSLNDRQHVAVRFDSIRGISLDQIVAFLPQGTPYAIKDLIMTYTPYELGIGGQIDYRNRPLWVTLRGQRPLISQGELLIAQQPPASGASDTYSPLTVSWEYQPRTGFMVKRIDGQLFGVSTDLVAEASPPSSPLVLRGDVSVDSEALGPLLPQEIGDILQRYSIMGRYQLSGQWWMNNILGEEMRFQGTALVNQWKVSGYMIDSLTANVGYGKNHVHIQDLVIRDSAGKVEAPDVLLWRSEDRKWQFSIDEIVGTDLVPSALRKAKGGDRRRTGIAFPKMTLSAFSGDLQDLSTLRGEGSARFSHSNRRAGGQSITSEMLSKVGLDLDFVTPTSGIIEYQIANGNVTLTRLKDVYSQGKLAKFLLPKDGKPCTIDFDGNLDLSIKVRPVQPLFKVADKVTLNVRGTIKNPVINLD